MMVRVASIDEAEAEKLFPASATILLTNTNKIKRHFGFLCSDGQLDTLKYALSKRSVNS